MYTFEIYIEINKKYEFDKDFLYHIVSKFNIFQVEHA